MNITRQNRKSLGLCIGCGQEPPKIHRLRCAECLEKASTTSKQYYHNLSLDDKIKRGSRPNSTRVSRKEIGKCIECGTNSNEIGSSRCRRCLSVQSKAQKYRYATMSANEKDILLKKAGEHSKERYWANRESCLLSGKKYRDKLKLETYTKYGKDGKPKCVCCGENNLSFLTIDHINNDGASHRKSYKGMIYLDLKKKGWPAGYQTLCFNCNCGRYRNNGTCPHELSPALTVET